MSVAALLDACVVKDKDGNPCCDAPEEPDYFGWPPDPAHPRAVCWSAESALNPVTVILLTFVLVVFFALGPLLAFLVFLVVLIVLTRYYL
jgi:hypothetical protein